MPLNGVSILQQACLFLPHGQCPAGWACAQSASIQSQHLEHYFWKNTWQRREVLAWARCQAQLPEPPAQVLLPPQGLVLDHQLLLRSKAEIWQQGRWNPEDSWCLRTCRAASCALSLLLCLGVLCLTTSSCAPKKKHNL